MNDVAFSEPVILYFNDGRRRKVATSFEALECLDSEWPEGARGRSWRSAVKTCRDALDGWRSHNEARRRFLKAASRAGLIENAHRFRRPVRPATHIGLPHLA